MDTKNIVHPNPIWRDAANFIIGTWCDSKQASNTRIWEQLWSRQIADNPFQICCIPFFAYNISLGDEVETRSILDREYAVERVAKASGDYIFRVWFGNSQDPEIRATVFRALQQFGYAFEPYSKNLLAIDAPTESQAQELADYLQEAENAGRLIYETGGIDIL